MSRTFLLITTATLGLAASEAAQACTLNALVLTCDAVHSEQSSAISGLTVNVTAGASVTKANVNPPAPALGLSGNNVTVNNAGQIINQRTNNNDANAGIQGTGGNLTVNNSGAITSGDRGIHITGGTGGFTLNNEVGATITSRRQAVRTLNDLELPNSTVTNRGTITSTADRAIQLRGPNAKVYNYGSLTAGDEVIEARQDFYLYNDATGTIVADLTVLLDSDGVQYASGLVENYGLISGTDDGIDVDEGTIMNGATGTIRARANGNGSGIDIDPLFDPSNVAGIRPSGDLRIVNAGLIEGPSAIGADGAAQNKITIENTGTLRGNTLNAIELAASQDDSSVMNSLNGKILGGVVFGGGDDVFGLAKLGAGAQVTGIVNGGAGEDLVELFYRLFNIASFEVEGDEVAIAFDIKSGGQFAARFTNFENWSLNGTRYTTAELQEAVSAIPLPAGLPLLGAALGGLALLRRRRR